MASYIPALVLQDTDNVYLNPIGLSKQIPTPDNGAYLDTDYWAIAVNYGAKTGFTYQAYNPNNSEEATPPYPWAIAVCRLFSVKTSDTFWVIGTSANYITACAGGTALPTTVPNITLHGQVKLPVCQNAQYVNATGKWQFTLAAPSPQTGNLKYYAYGYINGVALASLNTSGYADLATLVAAMVSNWGSPTTSPSITISWAIPATNTVVGTITGETGLDVFCGEILLINPSL
jgi:DNA-binding XRE family transcriptional regulator